MFLGLPANITALSKLIFINIGSKSFHCVKISHEVCVFFFCVENFKKGPVSIIGRAGMKLIFFQMGKVISMLEESAVMTNLQCGVWILGVA